MSDFFNSFKPSDWLTIIAILVGPIFAVWTGELLSQMREKKLRKLKIFETLMYTRFNLLTQQHVDALNMIDLEFYGEKTVVNSWKAYLDHLNSPPNGDAWLTRRMDLFIELLFQMAVILKYDFDKTHIKNAIYSPNAHSELENDTHSIRKGLVALLKNEKALLIRNEEIKNR